MPKPIFVVGSALAALILTLVPPFRLFLLLVLSLPLEAAFVLEVGFTVRLAYIILLITVVSLALRRTVILAVHSPLNPAIGAFVGVAAFSTVMTFFLPPPQIGLIEALAYRGSALRPLIQLALLLLFVAAYFLTIHFGAQPSRLTAVARAYFGVGIAIAMYACYQVVANALGWPFVDITNAISTAGDAYGAKFYTDPTAFRPHATFQEPLNLGHYLLSVTLPLLLVYTHPGRSRSAHPFAVRRWQLIVVLGALLLTQSRGAWLGFLVGYATWLLGGRRRTRSFVLLATGLLMASTTLLVMSPFGLPADLSALQSRLTRGAIAADPRWPLIAFAVDFWIRHPAVWLAGTGIGNFGLHSAAHFDSPLLLGANSLPLQILVEMGALGFLAFLAVIVRTYWVLLAALRVSRGTVFEGHLLGCVAALTGMLAQHVTFSDRLPLYEWVFIGLSVATAKMAIRSDARAASNGARNAQ